MEEVVRSFVYTVLNKLDLYAQDARKLGTAQNNVSVNTGASIVLPVSHDFSAACLLQCASPILRLLFFFFLL